MATNIEDEREIFATRFRDKVMVHIPEASQLEMLSAATKLLNTRQQLEELNDALQMKKEVDYFLNRLLLQKININAMSVYCHKF